MIALFLIAALSLLGLAANRNISVDTSIASSQLSAVQSFYLAEAGLQLGQLEAIQRLSTLDWPDFSPLLNNSTNIFNLSFNQAIPLGPGTYSVTAVNNSNELDPKQDKDRTIAIRSEGKCNGSTSVLISSIRALTIPTLPAGLTLVGGATMNVASNQYRISGLDHTLNDQTNSPTGSATPIPAIALCAGGSLSMAGNLVQNNLSGSATLTNSTGLSIAFVNSYIDDLKPASTATINCNGLNLTYQKGNVIMNCPAGEGVIVADGDLELVDGANWKGLVIVRGGRLKLAGNNEIRGGVIIAVDLLNGQTVGVDLSAVGGINLLYSREAIHSIGNRAIADIAGKWKVLSWQRAR
jgi:hypothetical protein